MKAHFPYKINRKYHILQGIKIIEVDKHVTFIEKLKYVLCFNFYKLSLLLSRSRASEKNISKRANTRQIMKSELTLNFQ